MSACTLNQQSAATAMVTQTVTNGRLLVAWTADADLYVWEQATGETRQIATDGVVRPYIAPEGQHVAFTRGPQGRAESLWVVDVDGSGEQQLVGRDDIFTAEGGVPLIGQVAWLDAQTLYFNTLEQSNLNVTAQDDLYRVTIDTLESGIVLPRSEGGTFAISPDRQHIALVYPGTYDTQDGVIRVIDPLGRDNEVLLFFVGVSTGASFKFYPELVWTPDSSAVLVAIPDADLVYDEAAAPPTQLWQLPVDEPSNRDIIGTVEASFFGLPRWSEDTNYITYLQRTGEAPSNTFELYVADHEGENPVLYATGDAGTLEPPIWIDGTQFFTYLQEGVVWLGLPGIEPQRLSAETVIEARYLEGLVVFTMLTGESIELRYGRLDDLSAPMPTIAVLSDPATAFDAVVRD